MPRWGRTALRAVLALVVVVAVFVGVLPQLADLEEAWAAIVGLSAGEAMALAGLAVAVLAATWVALARLIAGATLGQAGLAHLLSTAVANTVPAGGAVAVGVNLSVHASYGRSAAQTTTGLLTMGLLDNAVKLALPVALVALSPVLPGAEALPTSAALTALAVAAVLVVVLAALAREPVVARLAGRAQRVAARFGRAGELHWPAVATGYLRGLRAVLREHAAVAGAAVVATHLLQITLLVVALRSLGVPAAHAGLVRVTVVYTLVRLVTAVPVTPGGLGIAELGLVAGLQAGAPPGADEAIVAGALLFRVATFLLPVLLAPVAFVLWRVTAGYRDRPGAP